MSRKPFRAAFTTKDGQHQTAQEAAILRLYVNTEFSVNQIAKHIGVSPECAQKAINFWSCDITNDQGKTMAKSTDKNEEEREANMKKLRKGGVVYSLDMDKVRGMLNELQEGEAYIINRQSTSQRVNVRIGEMAFN